MDVITSTKNPAVRKVSSLLTSSRERRREGLFVVEGPRMAGEIPFAYLRGLYMTEDFAAGAGGRDLLEKAPAADIVTFDPGNLGTIIRTAEAAGISAVYMSSGCADILSPKVVRSTMGCLFRVPLIRLDGEEFYEEIKRQQEQGVRFVAAALGGTRAYDEISYDEKTAFLVGNEGNGLSARAIASADEKTIIPMEGHVESLNAAVAASILMFEATRQRRV